MSSKGWKVAWALAGPLVLIVGQFLGFCWIPGLDVLLYLLLGWIPFLSRVGPEINVRWDLVASTFAYATALIVGSHLFLRWVYREMQKHAGGQDQTLGTGGASTGVGVWPWRRTLGGFLILLLMFAAGTATVGIAHQTAWLARSPQSLYRLHGAGRMAQRIKCASNLRAVGQALLEHAEAHGGQFPDDLGVVARDKVLGDLQVLVCPATYYSPPDGVTPEQHAAQMKNPDHTSYVYFGKGVSRTAGADRVLAVEPLEHHQGKGINVLYTDGHTEWLEAAAAEPLLLSLGFERVEVPPQR